MHEPTQLDGLEESALVKMAKAGDKDAFGELMVRWETFIKTSLRRCLLDHADVDDAYQEIVMSAMQTIEKIKHDNFQGWMRITMRNRSYRFMTQMKSKTGWMETESFLGGSEFGAICNKESTDCEPSALYEEIELRENVMFAIEELPRKQREAIIGVFIEEKTQVIVASEVLVSRAAIGFRIGKAIESLRDSLSVYSEIGRKA